MRITGDHGLRIGRQQFELPYLGSHDIRMLPNTFEAVAVGRRASEGLSYQAGYVDAIKLKNSDDFMLMSEAAGVPGGDNGVLFAGAQYQFADGTQIGAINQLTPDVFNTVFARAERSVKFDGGSSLGLFLQYTDQSSVGSDLIGDFDTSLLATKVELSRGNATLRIGASTAGSERGIQKPWQSRQLPVDHRQ